MVVLLIALYTVLSVTLSVDTTQSVAIVRNNTTLGLAGFEKADSTSLYQLALVSILVLIVHTILSIRLRATNRSYALLTLGLGIVAQAFLVVITSSILSLHR